MSESLPKSEVWPPEAPELQGFKGPHVAVDVALLTVVESGSSRDFQLAFLVHKRKEGMAKGEWALPGRMVRERERLETAVKIALSEKCGITEVKPIQLYVFDEPTRDARGWVMSVGYLAIENEKLVREALSCDRTLDIGFVLPGEKLKLELPNDQKVLPFEQNAIVERAVRVIRREYEKRPDPYGLLGRNFTLYQLRAIHQAIASEPLDKDAFRRRMEPQLMATERLSSGSVGKPAQLFRRKSK